MNRLVARLGVVLLLLWGALAQAQLAPPPEVAARQHLLIDLASGQVLAEQEAGSALEPSGAVPLMTALLVLDALREGKLPRETARPVPALARAERRPGVPLMYAADTATPDELLRGLAALGARDAAVALAEATAGSPEAFVAQMNRRALALGLTQTVFRNATGATAAGQTSNLRELAVVARRLIADHAAALPLFAARQFSHQGIRQDNPNLLLGRDPHVDGLAVLDSAIAGHGLVATAIRDTPAGARRLLVLLSGAASAEAAASEAQKLLNWGWQAWDAVRLYAPGQPVSTVPVWKGARPEAMLGLRNGLVVTVPRGEGGRLRTTLTRTEPLVAPLVQGQVVGRIEVRSAGGNLVAEVPLEVLEPVPLAGLLGRAWDAIRLWIR